MGYGVTAGVAVYVSIKPEWLLESFQQKTFAKLKKYIRKETDLVAVVQDIDSFALEHQFEPDNVMFEGYEEENDNETKRRKIVNVLDCDRLYLIVCSYSDYNYKASKEVGKTKKFSLNHMQQSLGQLLQKQHLNDVTVEVTVFSSMS